LIAYVPNNSLLYVDLVLRPEGLATWMTPVQETTIEDHDRTYYTRHQVQRYLDTKPLEQKLNALESQQ
jgi:hypothetical protein